MHISLSLFANTPPVFLSFPATTTPAPSFTDIYNVQVGATLACTNALFSS